MSLYAHQPRSNSVKFVQILVPCKSVFCLQVECVEDHGAAVAVEGAGQDQAMDDP